MLPVQSSAAIQELLQTGVQTGVADANAAQGAGVFGDMWHAAAEQIQATDEKAQQAVSGLISGQGVEVHDAIIATQQADVIFELALQLRNKAVGAYQQMMQMQF